MHLPLQLAALLRGGIAALALPAQFRLQGLDPLVLHLTQLARDAHLARQMRHVIFRPVQTHPVFHLADVNVQMARLVAAPHLLDRYGRLRLVHPPLLAAGCARLSQTGAAIRIAVIAAADRCGCCRYCCCALGLGSWGSRR